MQTTQFGEADVESFIKVDRANGTTEYYRVADGQNIPITAAEYAAAVEG